MSSTNRALPSSNKPIQIRSARKQIQQEIDEYNERISRLKNELESLTSISQFPPEILAEIFIQFAQIYEEAEDAELKVMWRSKPYSWLPITHVCHRWREVALGAPRLWSRIAVNGNPTLLALVLERSQQAPIVLKVNIMENQASKARRFLEILRTHTPRLCSLDFRCHKFPLDVQSLTLDKPAPLLRSVVLVSVNTQDIIQNSAKLLLNFDTPVLEYLEIMNKAFVWEPTVFRPTLRALRLGSILDGHRATGARYPSSQQFIQSLRKMPLLEELHLENVFPIPNQPYPRGEMVNFPHLKRLRLMGTSRECTLFLRHVNFPYTANVDFTIKSLNDTQDLIEYFEPAMRARITPPRLSSDDPLDDPTDASTTPEDGSAESSSIPAIQSFAVRSMDEKTVLLQGWDRVLDIPDMKNDNDLNSFRIKVKVEGIVFTPANLFETMSRELPLSKVKILLLDEVNDITRPIWLNTLALMTQLETLHVREWSGEYLPEVLVAQQLRHPVLPGHSHTVAIFPKLRTIILDKVDFGAVLPGQPDHESGRFFPRFSTCLGTRKQRDPDIAIRKVKIRKAVNLNDSHVDELKPLVEEFEWDGLVKMKSVDMGEGGDEDSTNSEEHVE
ncbi:hypothetical protein NLI96_g1823 [Meripilus lineatus]|uniref:F-box domain-containing protein n=1 Tax=Meripilus lineatus TaxID=2056292 RepID=A0AAD5VA16_9APHY|nr:hypothetical protein NLI96_g1823 [Physisporinus lineatus]